MNELNKAELRRLAEAATGGAGCAARKAGMKSCWIVVLYWKSFPMVSTEKLTHAEALACVRSIWPNAEVE